MDEVADGLFVGTIEEAGDEALLAEHRVTTVVSLTHGEPEGGFPSDVTVESVPMKDGPRNERAKFERAVSRTVSRLEADGALLVQCSAGASRSPAVAATAVALSETMALETAFEQVAARRDAVDPHDAIVRRAARVYAEHREQATGE